MRDEDRIKSRYPWSRLIKDTADFVEPGCLPPGFRLKDPEEFKAAEMSQLWKHIHGKQHSGRSLGLRFTDKAIDLFKPRVNDSGRRATRTLDRNDIAPQLSGHDEMLQDLIPLKLEDDAVRLPATTRHPAIDPVTVQGPTTEKGVPAVIPVDIDRTSELRYACLQYSSSSCLLLTLEAERYYRFTHGLRRPPVRMCPR
jgi:hypothetical protein